MAAKNPVKESRCKTVEMRLADMKPAPYNPRRMSPEAKKALETSISRFGLVEPIIVNKRTGNIVGGHQRFYVLQDEGVAKTDVIVVDIDIAEEKALNVTLNNPHVAGEFTDEIGALIDEIRASLPEDVYLALQIQELRDDLCKDEVEDGQTDPDDVPAVPEIAISELGDIWTLGEHRLLCGDATSLEAAQTLFGDHLADMVFTDPPYNVNYGATMKDKRGNKRKIENDNLGADFAQFLKSACQTILKMNKGAAYICMSSSEIDTLRRVWKEAGGHWSTFVIWVKNTFTMGRSDYQRQYEMILYGWGEGSEHFWCGARDQGDAWFIDKPKVNDLHPTMKPVELVERAIHNSSKKRDLVYDPFLGSGTTMISAERLGRRCFASELDPKYVDVAVKRWQDFTGRLAVNSRMGNSPIPLNAKS